MNTASQLVKTNNLSISLNHNNLVQIIEQAMVTYAEQNAYSCLGQSMTFAQVDKKSAILANYLVNDAGLRAGDRVAIQLPNLIQYPIAAFAVLRAGLVLVNTNPLYTAREMQHQFSDSGAKALIILGDMLPKLEHIIDDTEIETVIATQIMDLINPQHSTKETSFPYLESVNLVALADILMSDKKLNGLSQDISLNNIAAIQYTGGTTGLSKGAVLTHGNLLSNLEQTSERLSHVTNVEKEIFVTPLPLYHVYAFLLNLWVFTQGNCNVLIPNPRDLDSFVNTLKEHLITGFCGINTLFIGLSHHERIKQVDFKQLKLTISGGAALTSAAVGSWKKLTGCTISEGYGLSETSPVVTLNPQGKEQIGSIGLPLKATEVQLWNENEQQVEQGEAGEIVVRGPQVMQGYWMQPKETAEVLNSDGWFKTGDIAIAQDDGFFRIVDRKKDMIIVSGFNVYPNEIENILVSHPDILEAAVIGEPCEKSGESVSAYVTTSVEQSLSSQDVIDHCRRLLTPYKIPKKVTFLNELPKSTVGKILRKDLREL